MMSLLFWSLLLCLVALRSFANDPIIIIGSGLAGHSATVELYNILSALKIEQNSVHIKHQIIIFEKEKAYGGNSKKATSGINGANTEFQHESLITDDSVQDFFQNTMHSAMPLVNEDLIYTLTSSSTSAVNWLKNEFQLDLSSISQCGGHSHPRTHRPPSGPAGFTIIKTIHQRIEENMLQFEENSDIKVFENIQFLYNCRVIEILMDETKKIAIGVRYHDYNQRNKENDSFIVKEMYSSAIIITSGGYANDHSSDGTLAMDTYSLLDEYSLNDENILPTTNGVWSTGDGIKMGRDIDAQLIHMNAIQIHPTGFIQPGKRDAKTKFLAPEALRAFGGLLVNKYGVRFVNELDLRSVIVAAEKEQELLNNIPLYLIMNEEIRSKFGTNFGFYMKLKLIVVYENGNHFCEYLSDNFKKDGKIYHCALYQTFVEYKASSYKEVDEFQKNLFPVPDFDFADKLYVAEITPVVHYTMGGLKINSNAEIYNINGDIIDGLFGAGEVTGGVHGANRLAGNSLLECVVFGRIAAQSAMKYCENALNEKQHQEL